MIIANKAEYDKHVERCERLRVQIGEAEKKVAAVTEKKRIYLEHELDAAKHSLAVTLTWIKEFQEYTGIK